MPFPFVAGAMLAGSALGVLGQYSSNRANYNIGRENNLFSAREALLNRDFQQRMSNTSWQRGVADMRAAGINPMLAVSQGGASSPSGNSAQGIAAANQQSELSQAAEGARNYVLTQAQLAQTAAQIRNTEANTAKTVIDAKNNLNSGKKLEVEGGIWSGISSAFSHYKDIKPSLDLKSKMGGDFSGFNNKFGTKR